MLYLEYSLIFITVFKFDFPLFIPHLLPLCTAIFAIFSRIPRIRTNFKLFLAVKALLFSHYINIERPHQESNLENPEVTRFPSVRSTIVPCGLNSLILSRKHDLKRFVYPVLFNSTSRALQMSSKTASTDLVPSTTIIFS